MSLVEFLACKASGGASRFRAKIVGLTGRVSAIGLDCRVGPRVVIRGGDGICIGDRVVLTEGCWLNALDSSAGTGPRIAIGNGARLGRRCIITAADSVVLGRDVLLAPNVLITDHQHGRADHELPITTQVIEDVAPVVIADGAWLGYGSVIMPGIRVGRNAVVGANSVVTNDVADGATVAGVPARPIL